MANNTGSNKVTMWFIIGFIVVVTAGVIIAGAYSSSSANNANQNSGFVSTTASGISAADHTEGNPNAKVTLIEYGDFECPACGEYFPVVQQLFGNYSSTVLFVFRNFPLYSIHPDAGIGAQAAEAAGLQGKYWQMNSLLYTNQGDWSTDDPTKVVADHFDGYASSLGLDVNKFNSDINSKAVSDKIASDVSGGNAASIDHTPTFFINLQQIPNPQNYADFKATIDAAIASSTGAAAPVGGSGVSVSSTGSGITISSTPL
jgi:protein-disulfide isomerase